MAESCCYISKELLITTSNSKKCFSFKNIKNINFQKVNFETWQHKKLKSLDTILERLIILLEKISKPNNK